MRPGRALRRARRTLERIDEAEDRRDREWLEELRKRIRRHYFVPTSPNPEAHADACYAAALAAAELGIEPPRVRWFRDATEDEAIDAMLGLIEALKNHSGMLGQATPGDTSVVWVSVERRDWWAIAETVAHEVRHTVQNPTWSRDAQENDANDYAAAFCERLREERYANTG